MAIDRTRRADLTLSMSHLCPYRDQANTQRLHIADKMAAPWARFSLVEGRSRGCLGAACRRI